jgi:ABC-type cobalt transport system substrate-binding protein
MNTLKADPQDKKLNIMLWIVGIAFSAFLGIGAVQMITFGEYKSQTVSNTESIEKIQGDYLPYFAFEYIVESNNKLMNILTAIDAKDDHRYEEAIKEWSDLQQQVINQAGKTKRGGSYGESGGM